MRPLLVLDSDGLLSDFVRAVLDFVEKETGTRPSREDIRTQNVWESIGDPQLKAAFNDHASLPGFCEGLHPYPEALEGFPELAEAAEVHISTSPWDSPTWVWERTAWLKKHFGIPASHVHHEPTKYLTRGDFFVDDHPKHVREWLLHRRDHYLGHAILWDTPHNRFEVGLRRVHSWKELTWIVKTASMPRHS